MRSVPSRRGAPKDCPNPFCLDSLEVLKMMPVRSIVLISLWATISLDAIEAPTNLPSNAPSSVPSGVTAGPVYRVNSTKTPPASATVTVTSTVVVSPMPACMDRLINAYRQAMADTASVGVAQVVSHASLCAADCDVWQVLELICLAGDAHQLHCLCLPKLC